MLNDITDVILLPASTRMFQILLQSFPVSSFLFLSLNSFYFVVMIVELSRQIVVVPPGFYLFLCPANQI